MIDFDSVPLDWREFDIPKKSGGVRHICAPNEQLKAVQRRIKDYLIGQSEFHEELKPTYFAHGFVSFRDTTTGISLHDWDTPVFLCMDIQDFFDNMPVEYVRGRLMKAGIAASLVDNIIRVCTYKGRFPQGSPCSPLIMNIGMHECDRMIAAYAKRNGFKFSRYADDITLSRDVNALDDDKDDYTYMFYGVEKILQSKLGLKLKREKSHTIWLKAPHTKRQITGVSVAKSGEAINAPMDMRRMVRAKCHELYCELQDRPVMPGDLGKWCVIKGYVSYFDHIRSKSRTEAARSGDPIIKEKEWNFLIKRFENGKHSH